MLTGVGVFLRSNRKQTPSIHAKSHALRWYGGIKKRCAWTSVRTVKRHCEVAFAYSIGAPGKKLEARVSSLM